MTDEGRRMKDDGKLNGVRSSFILPLSSLRRRGGFSLLELLLVAGLMALVATLIFGALRQVVAARDTCLRAAEPTRSADIAFEIIRKDFENAVPPTGTLASAFVGNDYPGDSGLDADEVTLFTTAPGPQHTAGDGEVRKVQYYITAPDGPQGEQLLCRKVIHNLLAPEEPPGDEEVVLRGIAGFSVQYWDSSTATLMTSWDSTQQDNAMPTMVAIEIDLNRPDPTLPPDSPPRLLSFTRRFQIPCAVAQPANVSGLSGSGLGSSGGGF